MAYDEGLAERIRAVVGDEPGVTERKMFGGLGFMFNGNMGVAAASEGSLMVRVDPADGAALVERDGYAPMQMRGREMTGWLLVAPEALAEDEQLAEAIAIGAAYARSLPPK